MSRMVQARTYASTLLMNGPARLNSRGQEKRLPVLAHERRSQQTDGRRRRGGRRPAWPPWRCRRRPARDVRGKSGVGENALRQGLGLVGADADADPTRGQDSQSRRDTGEQFVGRSPAPGVDVAKVGDVGLYRRDTSSTTPRLTAARTTAAVTAPRPIRSDSWRRQSSMPAALSTSVPSRSKITAANGGPTGIGSGGFPIICSTSKSFPLRGGQPLPISRRPRISLSAPSPTNSVPTPHSST